MFLGGLAWAVGQVLIRKLIDIRVMQITAWVAVFAVPQLFFMSAIFETGQIEALQNASSIVWWAVVYLGLVMTAFGYLLWNNLIRNHNVGKVAPFLLLLPIFSLIGGVVFLGEDANIIDAHRGSNYIIGCWINHYSTLVYDKHYLFKARCVDFARTSFNLFGTLSRCFT